MSSNTENIRDIINKLPSSPGVYRFYDHRGNLLYVGKAKNLKRRVKSYFYKNIESYRLKILVKQVADIAIIVVKSEQDALLLENELIKEHQPKYNVQLKDDKTYPWICIKNEEFPRVFSTRNRIDDGSKYFGPYTSAYMVKTLLDLVKSLYPLRNCSLNLSNTSINSKKYRVCLEYQIKNCMGPCEGLQNREEYDENIENIVRILKGNLNEVINYLKNLMNDYAGEYKYELAEEVKRKLEILQKFQSKSTIVSPTISNVDVFSLLQNEKFAFVNYLKVQNGAIIQSHNLKIKKGLDETDNELLLYAIADIKMKIGLLSKELIIPFEIEKVYVDERTIIPKIGDKKKLLDLSFRNAMAYKLENEKVKEEKNKNSSNNRIMDTMKADLRMKNHPFYIECFDNSNIQGTNPVSACVVFRNGKPSKAEYRHFIVRSVVGPDDFATMKEVLLRRYSRMIAESSVLPNLVIIDGGKGQLSAAFEVLKSLNVENEVTLIGIAKRLEEIYFPNDSIPLYLNKNSESLKVIQHARNEAHRFGITHHRKRREKQMIQSVLDDIAGIGEKSKELLLKEFKTVENIRLAQKADLVSIVGKAKAQIIVDFFTSSI